MPIIEEEPAVTDSRGPAEPSLPSILLGILVPALIFLVIAVFVLAVRADGGDTGADDLIPAGSFEGRPGGGDAATIDLTPVPTVTPVPRPPVTPRAAPTPQRPAPASTPPTLVVAPEFLPSGLGFVTIAEGVGPQPVEGEFVVVEYTGWLEDGTLFDTTFSPGREPYGFTLGSGVIDGFREGVALMRAGGDYRLIIPPELAYGERGQASIPPNATLIFDITLLAITDTTVLSGE